MLRIGNIELSEFPLLLAPMEDITDPPFRKICKRLGADLMYTEFISSEGLIRDAVKSTLKLDISEDERPIGIQIFGHDIDSMKEAARIAETANPDLIDINFGCPVKKVVVKGAGAALLKDIPKMVRMTQAIVKATSLPVTLKTRLGWDEKTLVITDVVEQLQDAGIAAITIHGRTRAQVYSGFADWTLIGEVKKNPRIKIPVFGNGDIDGPVKAAEMIEKYKVDGIMIGRASIGNPWIFRQIKEYLKTGTLLDGPGMPERLNVCLEHLQMSVVWKGEKRGVNEMRKHYSGYFKGVRNFKHHKLALMHTASLAETEDYLYALQKDFING